ncbi:MAG: DedA family protein [Bdellovibrionaceae bacterium]|nr:DedA family protein [Bdellovibrionales bacterium]MCB9086331.1 DedA family protein [Pseudobdellovibrionaceae bacterium]
MSSTTSSSSSIPGMGWVRRMYDWLMKWSDHRHASAALAGLAFIEAFFFPLPVDPLLAAMGTAKPKKALWFSVIATLFSVLGSLGGYLLGRLFWEATQDFFFAYVFAPEKLNIVLEKFQDNAYLAIFLAGFTPIPYKVFAIAGGIANVGIAPMVVGGLVGRGMRFGIIGICLYFFGPKVRELLDKYLERFTLVFGVLIIVGFVLYRGLTG